MLGIFKELTEVIFNCTICKKDKRESFESIPDNLPEKMIGKTNTVKCPAGEISIFKNICKDCDKKQRELENLEKILINAKNNNKDKKYLIEALKKYDVYEILLFLIQKK
ncbi:MAG: hypothetical protein KBD12_02340 [Candidatus Pacebacteria bacterium]|nr:hypothetical protein [Candidatus Paceibacterota bacterium]